MSQVAVLGAGAGGLASVVHLAVEGHDVRLWNRSRRTLEPILSSGCLTASGVLGEVRIEPQVVTEDLDTALAGAEVAVVSLPALAHEALFDQLALREVQLPLVLNPGGSCGALHLRARYLAARQKLPPVVEFSTLSHVARASLGAVQISGIARSLRAGCLPGAEVALEWGCQLFKSARPAADVIESSLSNVNLILHPPGAVLAAAWVEAEHGKFRFYVDAMTSAVGRVMEALDAERLEVGAAYGHELLSLVEEMVQVGTISEQATKLDMVSAVRSSEANRAILAPDSTSHRYYREDLPFALLALVSLGDIAGCELPTARALLALGQLIVGEDLLCLGRSPKRLGLEGIDYRGLCELVGAEVQAR